MGSAAESAWIPAPIEAVWELYFEPGTWAAWVDGFASVEASEGYPAAGGTLRWRSNPAGRGTVEERVLEHVPRRRHLIAFSDEESEGELETTFEDEPGGAGEPAGTLVTQRCDYRLRRRSPFSPLTDFLFVRSAVQRSLGRSLERLRREVEELAQGAGASPPGAQ